MEVLFLHSFLPAHTQNNIMYGTMFLTKLRAGPTLAASLVSRIFSAGTDIKGLQRTVADKHIGCFLSVQLVAVCLDYVGNVQESLLSPSQ